MRLGERGLALLEDFEKLRLNAYLDSKGVVTIGWGHTGPEVHLGMTITKEEADAILEKDLAWAEAAMDRMVTVELTQAQYDALVCFTFNVGAEAFRTSTLLRDLNSGATEQAALQFLRWDKSGGVELSGLLRRREAEMELFNS